MVSKLLDITHALILFVGTAMVGLVGGLTAQSVLMERRKRQARPLSAILTISVGLSYGLLVVSALLASWYADYRHLPADPTALVINIVRAVGLLIGFVALVKLAIQERYEQKEDGHED